MGMAVMTSNQASVQQPHAGLHVPGNAVIPCMSSPVQLLEKA